MESLIQVKVGLEPLIAVLRDLVVEIRKHRLAAFPEVAEPRPSDASGDRVTYASDEESSLESYRERVEELEGLPVASKEEIIENLIQGE